MARKCIQCGADIRDGVAFCTECGAKAPETVQSSVSSAFCVSCGAPMKDGIAFCTSCGAKQGDAAPVTPPPKPAAAPPPPPQTPPVYQTPPPQQPVYQQPVQLAPQQSPEQSVKGTKYEPITTGGFIGIMLLLCIPVIGLILLIVWACGGCRKISKCSFARATLILGIIMAVLGLVIGLVFGSMIQSLLKDAGLDISGLGQESSWFDSGKQQPQDTPSDDNPLGALGELGVLLEGLEGLTGQEGSGNGLEGLISGVEDANKDAEANSDGWPKSLRAYPGGAATLVESYRTEITGTTLDEMKAYIEDLKKDGYKFQDFYDFGFSEEDMLAMNGWWGTNGEIYLAISFAEGTVTVDHTYELPDLNFG